MAMAATPNLSPPPPHNAPPAILPAAAMSMQLQTQPHPPPATAVSDAVARDAIIAWFRSEFAAANSIIDALCGHLVEIGAEPPEYGSVFAAVHRRRMNWIPVLQMQKFHSIAEVTAELKRVAARRADEKKKSCGGGAVADFEEEEEEEESVGELKSTEISGGNHGKGEEVGEDAEEESPESDVTDSGSQDLHPISEETDQICSNHANCDERTSQIKLTKGFKAKEMVKRRMVNVVKGLKLFEDAFTDSEICKLTNFVNELHLSARKGQLSGDSFILFNEQTKGSKRELIQFGLPIFEQIIHDDNNASKIEPIPSILQDVIDHFVQWQLIPSHKKPNSCIINFFDEGDYSMPFLKPPHLDQPVSVLSLSDSTMAFGRFLASDSEGNYKAPLTLSLKQGSLVVKRGNSSDIARHAMCSSPTKRVTVTFFRVRTHEPFFKNHAPMEPSYPTHHIQPNPYAVPNGALKVVNMGLLQTPVVMLAPLQCPLAMSMMSGLDDKVPCEGTGVFLPWRVRKPVRRLPPRALKGRS